VYVVRGDFIRRPGEPRRVHVVEPLQTSSGYDPQLDKFKQAARELETDDNPERFKERLKKVVKHKPVEKRVEKPG
jgi:hypothetical protein